MDKQDCVDGIERNVSSRPSVTSERNVPTTEKHSATVHEVDEECQPEPINVAENDASVTCISPLREKSSRPARPAFGNFLISMPSVSRKLSILNPLPIYHKYLIGGY